MSVAELQSLRAPLVASEHAGYYSVVEFCKFVRDNHIRDEQSLIAKQGLRILKSNSFSLGNDAYVLAEQVCVACLDVHNFEDAEYCLRLLEKQFSGSSSRVLRLRGMVLEFRGQATGDAELFTAATVVYQSILEKDPSDSHTLKRQISVAKSQGLRHHAIKLLVEYLKIFGSDFEAWLELANLYLDQSMHQNAAFCIEELIIIQPQNYHLYVKYGEILVTVGGVENLLLARKQFSFSLELSTVNNLRAWWGLATTANAITSTKGVSPKDIKISVDLYDLALQKITEATKPHKNHEHTLAVLQALAPTLAARNVIVPVSTASSAPASASSTPNSLSTNTTPSSSSRSASKKKT